MAFAWCVPGCLVLLLQTPGPRSLSCMLPRFQSVAPLLLCCRAAAPCALVAFQRAVDAEAASCALELRFIQLMCEGHVPKNQVRCLTPCRAVAVPRAGLGWARRVCVGWGEV
jgi:hypothetical protein